MSLPWSDPNSDPAGDLRAWIEAETAPTYRDRQRQLYDAYLTGRTSVTPPPWPKEAGPNPLALGFVGPTDPELQRTAKADDTYQRRDPWPDTSHIDPFTGLVDDYADRHGDACESCITDDTGTHLP